MKIPFNRPHLTGNELRYVGEVLDARELAGNGRFTRLCEEWMEERFGANRVFLTTSCTHALEMAAILSDVGPGDEIIMPSFTFVSTANAFALRGARIRFLDVRDDTLNLDERLLDKAIRRRTKAVVPVHYAGVACEMNEIVATASRHGIRVVEDAAHGIGARYGKRYLGTIGHMGTYSFHETKNVTCGVGGAIVLNDAALIERAEILREKGTNRSRYSRGQVEKYTWVDLGSSYLPSEILAAILYAQLEELENVNIKRRTLCSYYVKRLECLASEGLLRLPVLPPGRDPNGHLFHILLPDGETRDRLMAALKEASVQAVFHYVPLHNSLMGRRVRVGTEALPVTEEVSARLLRLPLYAEMTRQEQDVVVGAILRFFEI